MIVDLILLNRDNVGAPVLFINKVTSGSSGLLTSHSLGDMVSGESADLAELWFKWMPGHGSVDSLWV